MAVVAAGVSRKQPMYGLVEWDVTAARTLIGERSFTAFLAASIGRAAARHPRVAALASPFGGRVVYEDVDIMVLVESEVDGGSVPVAQVVRGAQRKSVDRITAEIRRAQDDPVAGPSGSSLARWLSIGRWIPSPLLRLVVWTVDRVPIWHARIKGTVALSSIGMFAAGAGWGFAPIHHSLAVTVGGIRREGDVEFLSITLGFDHAIIDGGPAARFAADLQRIVESAEVLT